MEKANIIPVILSGGSGSRLWPLSREAYPKQLLRLVGENSLLQDTAERAKEVSNSKPIIVCNESHRFLIASQLQEIGLEGSRIILESVGKNTAPAIAVSAINALEHSEDEDPILLVMPADHVIKDLEGFRNAVEFASAYAEQDKLVTFGVVPDKPETGFGYIQIGDALGDPSELSGFKVKQFVEKPDEETAREYVTSGYFYWNSGIFMFRAKAYLTALAQCSPEIFSISRKAVEKTLTDPDFCRLDADIFSTCPSDSIDYAVMEKADNVVVVPMQVGWSDMGSWSALSEVKSSDDNGNITKGNVHVENAKNCYLHSETRLLAAVGVSDHIVVETADAVLVAHKDHCQDVKAMVNQLKQKGHSESVIHQKVQRPWGYFDSINQGEGFQVKRISVFQGERFSLQLHKHRSEHWIIVSGKAKVTRGEEEFVLTENQSVCIPKETIHRIENIGEGLLEFIEVQCGEYLEEDDIVRLEDDYGRVGFVEEVV